MGISNPPVVFIELTIVRRDYLVMYLNEQILANLNIHIIFLCTSTGLLRFTHHLHILNFIDVCIYIYCFFLGHWSPG